MIAGSQPRHCWATFCETLADDLSSVMVLEKNKKIKKINRDKYGIEFFIINNKTDDEATNAVMKGLPNKM